MKSLFNFGRFHLKNFQVTLKKDFTKSTPYLNKNMSTILDGKVLAEEMNLELKNEIKTWVEKSKIQPFLVCILVGDDQASATYVKKKKEAAEKIGIRCDLKKFDSSISQSELLKEIKNLNEDPLVNGILIQLPVPDTISERIVCNAVSQYKDVDGFHISNVGELCLDMANSIIPCTAYGVMEILRRNKIETFGKNAVVVGRSKNVALPIAMILHSDGKHESHYGMDASVTICHRYTPPEKLKEYCLNADIIVSATGVPGLIKADMVKSNTTVIDIGITRVDCPKTGKPKLVGDVDFEAVSKIKGIKITPVPGGVGPMTVAMLMRNTFLLAKRMHPDC